MTVAAKLLKMEGKLGVVADGGFVPTKAPTIPLANKNRPLFFK
jgi:hypothetical protein